MGGFFAVEASRMPTTAFLTKTGIGTPISTKRITASEIRIFHSYFAVDIFCDFVMIRYHKQILNMITQKGAHGN